jgi:hypothetical protein
MVFGSQDKLIEDEHLEDFLTALGYFWDCGYSAARIAKEMNFKSLGLKTYHVYYFSEKYRDSHGFTPRTKSKKRDKSETSKIPIDPNMSEQVINTLRENGLLAE